MAGTKRAVQEALEAKIVQFTLEGASPLIMHSPRGMRAASEPELGRKTIPLPDEEAEAGAYRLPDGALCFPAVGVRNCILKAAVGIRLGKKAAQPYFAASLLPADMMFPLTNAEGEPLREYVVDIQRAVVQRQGIMRARPRIDPPWFLVCTFRWGGLISQDQLRETINVAGNVVGIGDYRIERKGWFGQFRLHNLRFSAERA